MIIPYQQLSADALRGVLEEFINREGTDYGEVELEAEQKFNQLRLLLKSGRAVVVFDEASETTGLVMKQDLVI